MEGDHLCRETERQGNVWGKIRFRIVSLSVGSRALVGDNMFVVAASSERTRANLPLRGCRDPLRMLAVGGSVRCGSVFTGMIKF